MKITTIEVFPIWVARRNQLLVQVTTDDGIYGWGESLLATRKHAVMDAFKRYRELLIRRDAFDIGGVWQLLFRSQYFDCGRVLSVAISAIDIALQDIKGKALDVPVWQLLGGKQRNVVPSFATAGTPDDDEQIEQLASLAADGFACLRIAISQRSTIARDACEPRTFFEPPLSTARNVPIPIRARERLGHEVNLDIDYHHELSAAGDASFCQQQQQPGTLDFPDEPIRDEMPDAYAALRRMTNVRFAIGEEFCSKWQAQPYLEPRPGPAVAAGHLPDRRLHRGQKCRSRVRCALCRSDAAQPARANRYRRFRPSGACGAEFLLARIQLEQIPSGAGTRRKKGHLARHPGGAELPGPHRPWAWHRGGREGVATRSIPLRRDAETPSARLLVQGLVA